MEEGAKSYGALWEKVGSLPPSGSEASSSLSWVVRVSEALRTVWGAVIPWLPEVWTLWGFSGSPCVSSIETLQNSGVAAPGEP